MKYFLLRLIRSCDDLLHRLLRGNRRQMLIDGETMMHFAMFETIYGALRLDKRIGVHLTCSWEGGLKVELASIDGVLPEASDAFTPYSRAKWKKWDVYMSSCFDSATLFRNVPWVEIFHGVGEKWAANGEHFYMTHPLGARYDRLLCTSRRVVEQYLARPEYIKTPNSPRLVGLSKSDPLVWLNKREIQRALKEGLGCDPDRMLCLFAPTVGKDGALANFGEDVIRTVVGSGAELIVKLHSCSYLPDERYHGGVDWMQQMDEWSHELGFRHLPETSLMPLMLAADVLISDFGSTPVEFCLLDRPLIFFNCPAQAARIGGDGLQFKALCEAGTGVGSTSEFDDTLRVILAGRDELGPARERIRDEFFYAPGEATKNALTQIYELLELSMPDGLVDRYCLEKEQEVLSSPCRFLGLAA